MRLRPEKIQMLAELIHDALVAHPELKLEGERDAVAGLIRRVIAEDLQAEDELEEEARRLLEEHREEMTRKGIAFDKMLLKTKQKLARERRFTL